MANRTVAVAFKAEVGQYVAGMSKASAATMRLGESARDSQTQASKHFDMAGKGALIMGGAIVAGLGMAVAKSMEFEKSMSAISAATGASGADLAKFRDAAMKAGAETAFSATEAADAITEMAKAGVSAKDIMGGGLKGALSLAAAGQIDVAEAAGIASTAMTQFSLSGKDLPHVADLLAAGAGKAMGSVDDLGMALNQAGLIASAAGLSIEETTGGLAAFASAGLLGSDAGTSFKTMLQAIQAPSEKSANLMAELGLNMYDANGNMLGLADMAGQLQTHLNGLTEEQRNSALATIFGSDAVRAANVLYKEGATGINEWTHKVNDSGYAAKQAAALQDNLSGDLEKLGGSFETLMISIGQGLQGPARGLTQFFGTAVDGATGLIKIFGDLPGPVQAAIGAFGVWAAAGSRISDVFGAVRGKVQGFREELQLQQSLMAMQSGNLSDADRALGGLGTTADVAGKKFGMARAAVGGFAKAIGPELGVAAAIYLVGDLASKINSVATAGDAATDQIRTLNGTIKDADSNSARFEATNAGLDDMRSKLRDAQQIVDHFEGQNPFDQWVWRNPFGSEMEDAKDAKEAIAHYNEEIDKLEAGHRRAESSTQALADKLHLSKAEVVELADKYGIDLTGKVDTTRIAFETLYTREYGTTPIDAANATANAMVSAKTLTEEAQKAQEDYIKDVAAGMADFVTPLETYKGLLQEKAQAEADAANKTAGTTGAGAKSWEDFKNSVHVTFADYVAELQAQVDAQTNWQTNLLLLAGRVSAGTLAELARMGPEGAPLIADLVNKSDAELAKLEPLVKARSQESANSWAKTFTDATPILAAIGKQAGQGVVEQMVAQLQAGTITVAELAAKFGLNLAGGVNPLLAALGKGQILAGGRVVATDRRNTTGTSAYYEGGYTGHGGKYEPAGVVHKGEYVLTKEQTSRLGIDRIEAFANNGYAGGGFVTAADVPKPYSTAPYQPPISTAADAVMQREYDEVTAFMKAQEAAQAASVGAAAGAGVQRWLPVVLQSLAMIGQPASLAQTVLRRMNQESGGNPTIVNRTDSNWARGTPSVGLMQVIGPTYRAYKDGRRDVGPYSYGTSVDPLANILASEHYAMSRYGSLSAAYNKAGGYAGGGVTPAGDPFWVGEQGPELMWSSREKFVTSAAQSREFAGTAGGSGGGSVSVPAPIVKVYLDGQEWRGMARVEAEGVVVDAFRGATTRSKNNTR